MLQAGWPGCRFHQLLPPQGVGIAVYLTAQLLPGRCCQFLLHKEANNYPPKVRWARTGLRASQPVLHHTLPYGSSFTVNLNLVFHSHGVFQSPGWLCWRESETQACFHVGRSINLICNLAQGCHGLVPCSAACWVPGSLHPFSTYLPSPVQRIFLLGLSLVHHE